MKPEATRMYAEAADAGATVQRQRAANAARVAKIADALRRRPPLAVLTCARGSSDHAATFGKYLIETQLGIPVASMAPSVASVYRAPLKVAGMLALAVSQSGRSPDLLAALDHLAEGGATTLALVNDEASPLAAAAAQVLPLHAGPEHSVAATKSFIASLAAFLDLASAWSGDRALAAALEAAPAQVDQAFAADWSPLVDELLQARSLFVVGRGLGLGVAQEAALKCKETAGLHAEAFSAAEVRHGPMAILGPGVPLLVLRQEDDTRDSIDALVADTLARGGRVLVAGPAIAGAIRLPCPAAHPAVAPMLQIAAFYRAANSLAIARGFDPDAPPYLQKVTKTV